MKLRTVVQGAALAVAAYKVALLAARRSRKMALQGKVALVCGASRGLGRAIARELAERGCRVAICARSEADLDETRTELERLGATVYAEVMDLRSKAEVEALVSNVAARLGPIDVLVANAATIGVGPIEAMKVSDFQEAIDSIFMTSLQPALAVLPRMRARRTGTVAFVTSIGGKIGVPHLAPYSAAKFAEVGLAQAMRAEVAKDGVHVLTVVPGLMRTGSHVHGQFRGDPEKEYTWFGASATAPVLSIDADRAAKRIVSAIARGDTELVYTLPARLVARLSGLFPQLFSEVMGLAARMLPRLPEAPREQEGIELERRSTSPGVAYVREGGRPFAEHHAQTR
jgi:short-subunit dehydrogenase